MCYNFLMLTRVSVKMKVLLVPLYIYRYNTELRSEFPFVKDLNSHACQASVERCWSAVCHFFDNCKNKDSW